MSRASCSPSRGEKSSAFCASFIAVMITPMRELPQALYRARDVRELDRLAIEQGTSGYELMTRAGAALLRVLRGRWPRARRLTVVCGGGNNGGDGFVVARLAHEAGLAVTVIMPRPPAHLHGEALSAHEALREAGLETQAFSPAIWPAGDVIVDALFGTGLHRDIAGAERETVTCMNAAQVPVIAADIPSGLHADSGRVLGVAVRAHTTVSFIGLKQGLFTGDGPAYCGDIVFDALGVPALLRNSVSPAALRILAAELLTALPPRRVDADALNLLARDPLVRTRWVLTPHPGEAARLLACTASEVQAERFAALHALRARYGGVVVLKGAGSLILGDDEVVRVCDAGNPGMASGGMGDVLTGVIAGLAAQGMPQTQTAWLGTHLHTRACDTAARGGQRGLVASELMPALRQWANPPPCIGCSPAKRPCSPRAPRLRAPARRARRYFISWVISAPARLPWRVAFCAGSGIWARSRARHIPCSSSTTSRAGPSITSTSIASPIRASSMTSAYAIASTVIRCC